MMEEADDEERRYSVFFQINRQAAYELKNLARREYVRLKCNDDFAYERIQELLESGEMTNDDEYIEVTYKSIDGVDFTRISVAATSLSTIAVASSNVTNDVQSGTIEGSDAVTTSLPDSAHLAAVQSSDQQKSKKKTGSYVWSFFKKIDNLAAQCDLCKSTFKHRGNTSNILQHLSRKHPSFCDTRNASTDRQKKRTLSESSNDVGDPDATSSPSKRSKNNSKAKLRRDIPIKTAFLKSGSFADGGSMADRITNALLYMIASDNMPFSVVENDGFKLLMKTAVPLYTLPSRKTVTSLMSAKYQLLKNDVQLRLNKAESYSISCDNWTDVSNLSYLGVTIHYATSDGQLRSGCLGVIPLHERHTAGYLSETLFSVLESFELSPEKVTAVVSDSAANIKKAVCDSFGRSKHLPCFAHIMSHLVPDAMACDSMTYVRGLIDKVRNIVILMKRSVVASDELKRLQIRDGKTESTALKFIRDVPTRWNSTLYMLERFLVLEDYVYSVTAKCRNCPELLRRDEILLLKNICGLLTPIERVITEISGDSYPTASLIIPIIRCLEIAIRSCEPETLDVDAKVLKETAEFKAKLLEAIERRFKDQEFNSILAIPTLLDPRFKRIHFQSAMAASTAITKINTLLKPIAASENSNRIPAKSRVDQLNIWGHHDRMVSNEADLMCNNDEGINLELRQFLNQPVIPRSEDPLKYWISIKAAYPSLHKLGLKYLSILATSVPSERLFSKAGSIKVENRSRISGEHLNELLFLGCLSREEWGLA